MNIDNRLKRLDEHQAAIHALVRRGERLLGAADHDAPELARGRWELARAIMAYQGFKHREIFDPITARGTADQARTARRLKAKCVARGDAFRAYVAKWSAVSVLDRWDEYRPAAIAMIAEIKEQLTRERGEAAMLLGEPAGPMPRPPSTPALSAPMTQRPEPPGH
ncbi:MAG TPA: hypothetical protein VF592_05700 [Sphingomonas sp.]|jgi:hypothetical protein|uniref:hypothetical protein n=1 Tax=Sphingomonas sp. TaxID=28214 RepID=UPI002ED86FC2